MSLVRVSDPSEMHRGESSLSQASEERSYWIQVFTPKTWDHFVNVGANVTGFRPTRWKYIQSSMRPGDYILCYLSGVKKWIGALEIKSDPYLDVTPIWEEDLFPCRADVKLLVQLSLDDGVLIQDLKDQLSIFRAKNWSLYLISSPSKWKTSDGEAVLKAILDAQRRRGPADVHSATK